MRAVSHSCASSGSTVARSFSPTRICLPAQTGQPHPEAVRKLPVFLTDGGWAVDLEVMSRDTDKGVALRALAEKLGIAREQVLAMGDSGNDCAMLRYAGVGAAMGNAGEQAKKAADVIAPSNREDGVAWMLRRAARGEV